MSPPPLILWLREHVTLLVTILSKKLIALVLLWICTPAPMVLPKQVFCGEPIQIGMAFEETCIFPFTCVSQIWLAADPEATF